MMDKTGRQKSLWIDLLRNEKQIQQNEAGSIRSRASCHSDAVFWDDVDELGLEGDPSLRDSSSTHCHLAGSSTPEDAGDLLSEHVIRKQNQLPERCPAVNNIEELKLNSTAMERRAKIKMLRLCSEHTWNTFKNSHKNILQTDCKQLANCWFKWMMLTLKCFQGWYSLWTDINNMGAERCQFLLTKLKRLKWLHQTLLLLLQKRGIKKFGGHCKKKKKKWEETDRTDTQQSTEFMLMTGVKGRKKSKVHDKANGNGKNKKCEPEWERERQSKREEERDRKRKGEMRGRLALQLADSQHPALEGKRFSAEVVMHRNTKTTRPKWLLK